MRRIYQYGDGIRLEFFTTQSCYVWLEYDGISMDLFKITWTAHIPLKIKIFLWLVQNNKLLTKDNLQSNRNFRSSIYNCLWHWISRYNNFIFNCSIIQDLWELDAQIPYKEPKLCELIRGAFIWVIWNERNRLIFNRGNCNSVIALESSIIIISQF
jgi:zinc-binding in reverse transcriptase